MSAVRDLQDKKRTMKEAQAQLSDKQQQLERYYTC